MLKKVICLSLLSFFGFVSAALAQAPPNDGRDADRAAVRAHIESIFQAFIDKDIPKLRATHSEDWRGFLEGSPVAIKGIEEYMNAIGAGPNSAGGVRNPNAGMASYKMTDVDMIFHGPDMALTCFNADVTSRTGESRKLRILDIHVRRNGHWIQASSHTAIHPQTVNKQMTALAPITEATRKSILEGREKVWRAYFSGDRAALEKLIPEETIAINDGEEKWANRAEILAGSEAFAKRGAKLVRLEFPKTEIQIYGRTIILYTTYLYEIEANGQRNTTSGRGTEIFVIRDNVLVNTGWHLDVVK